MNKDTLKESTDIPMNIDNDAPEQVIQSKIIKLSDRNFQARFQSLLVKNRELAESVTEDVTQILADIRENGDRAVLRYTQMFDKIDIDEDNLRIPPEAMEEAYYVLEEEAKDALHLAHDRIKAYHEKQLPESGRYTDELGVEMGHIWNAVHAAGLYVPGGTAAYPSSVLMNAIPAKVAGVKRMVMCVPTPFNAINPYVLAAAHLAGIDEVYRIGGAQAIGAMAFGTAMIAPVNVIVGPGNSYVAEAKRQVFGKVGIDMVAGPSEVLIIADESANADWVAADLLAQAEHDRAAQSILITDNEQLAEKVLQEVEVQIEDLPRRDIAQSSWVENGAIILVDDLEMTPPLINQIAPEHLELSVKDPEKLLQSVDNAGAVFLGHHSPEVLGDYVAGPNHVLPTDRTARFASGLSVLAFMKRISVLKANKLAMATLGPAAMTLAKAEGLDGHARSIEKRLLHNEK